MTRRWATAAAYGWWHRMILVTRRSLLREVSRTADPGQFDHVSPRLTGVDYTDYTLLNIRNEVFRTRFYASGSLGAPTT